MQTILESTVAKLDAIPSDDPERADELLMEILLQLDASAIVDAYWRVQK